MWNAIRRSVTHGHHRAFTTAPARPDEPHSLDRGRVEHAWDGLGIGSVAQGLVIGRRRTAILYSPSVLRPNKDLRRFVDSVLFPSNPSCRHKRMLRNKL
jgi:hypothetical protein